MILLPIGHENMTVRRLPWVSIAIFSVCLVAHLSILTATGSRLEQAEDDMGAAIQYWMERPYLQLDDEAKRLFEGSIPADHLEALHQAAPVPEDPEERAAEQAELDARFRKARDLVAGHPFFRFGLVPANVSLLGLFAHMFLHGGWLHFLGNMFFLYLAGPFIEDAWGRPLYAGFYLLAGLVAAVGYVVLFPSLAVPLIGASGAIAGLMGAFLVRFWSTKITFFWMVGIWARGTFEAPAFLMLPLWLLQQVFYALLVDGGADGGVAYWAHVFGFVFGAGAAALIRQQRIEERFIARTIEQKISTTVAGSEVIEQAYTARAAGDLPGAVALLREEWDRQPGNADLGHVLWVLAIEAGQAAEAAPVLAEVIKKRLRENETDLALQHWAELEPYAPGLRLGPAAYVKLGALLADHNQRDAAVRALHRALVEGGNTLPGPLALKIARLARTYDPAVAEGAARIAASAPDLGPAERAEAEALLNMFSALTV